MTQHQRKVLKQTETIAKLVEAGMRQAEIAKRLRMSETTVCVRVADAPRVLGRKIRPPAKEGHTLACECRTCVRKREIDRALDVPPCPRCHLRERHERGDPRCLGDVTDYIRRRTEILDHTY